MDGAQEGPAHRGPWCGPRCQDYRAAARGGSGAAPHVRRFGNAGERGGSGERVTTGVAELLLTTLLGFLKSVEQACGLSACQRLHPVRLALLDGIVSDRSLGLQP